MFLTPAGQVLECYSEALVRLKKITDGKKGSNYSLFKCFLSFRPSEHFVNSFLINLVHAVMVRGSASPSTSEMRIIDCVGHIGGVGTQARNVFWVFMKIFLVLLYDMGCILLPYKFTRPLLPWLDDLNGERAVYTEVILAFRALDISKSTGAKSNLIYDPVERKIRTAFQMGVKLSLSSTWHKPEDVTLEDLLQWRSFSLYGTIDSSPLPLQAIAKILKEHFGDRLPLSFDDIGDLGTPLKSGDSISRLARRKGVGVLESVISCVTDPIALVEYILDELKLAAVSFSGPGLERLHVVKCWAGAGVNIGEAVKLWSKLEAEYLDSESYEKDKGWNTAFGRMNCYLFVYLPAWFQQNPESEYVYPSTPNKFVGRIYYKPKLDVAGARPLSFSEFSDVLGFEFYYSLANNLRLFFIYLMDFCSDIKGCENLTQPIWWLPPAKKSDRTPKHAFTADHEDCYMKYLDAIETAASFLDEHVSGFAVRYSSKESGLIDFNEVGYIPIVYLSDGLYPILSISRKALVLTKIKGRFYYNPATTVFPYCLVRAGVRGQNLQWLSALSYGNHVDRQIDPQVGLSYLYINTDKIRNSPFTVHCRFSVIEKLDSQAEWRHAIFHNTSAVGFDKVFPYDGLRHSKWGSISCLFCNDEMTGEPIRDEVYTQVITYSQLDFQSWARKFFDRSVECAVYMGTPREMKSRKSTYYTWEQWQVAREKSSIVKVSKGIDPDFGNLEYCPINLRSKVTAHGGRVTHITQLLSRLSPEDVAKTTGQTVKTVLHYDTGADDFRRRFAGVVNNKEPLKRPVNSRPQVDQQFDALLSSRGSGNISELISSHGLLNFSDDATPDVKEPGAFEIIAQEKSANLVQCSTHICVRGFVCPGHILLKFKGRKLCPWCPLAVFSLNSIFAVAAKRHQLAEDFERIQIKIAAQKVSLSSQESVLLESELQALSEELIAWYFLERTLDSLIFQRSEGVGCFTHVVGDREVVKTVVTRHVTERGSSEDFLRRLDEIVEYPSTMSIDFRDKVNRAIRLVLAQKGRVYEALFESVSINPEVRLAALIRDDVSLLDLDTDKLIRLLNISDEEWFKSISEAKGLNGRGYNEDT
ncbi:hypothetical protein TRP66_18345 [Pseudomonas sp. JDS28PS106]